MAWLQSERNQLFTALMEWNVNLSKVVMALLAMGHYWASAFFPSQANLLCRLNQNCAESSLGFYIIGHLMADCSYSTTLLTCELTHYHLNNSEKKNF